MAGHTIALGLLSVFAVCVCNPVYEHQPFGGYHYPEISSVGTAHGYFYGPPAESFSFYQAAVPAPAFTFTQLSRSAICTLTNTSKSSVSGEVRFFQGRDHEPIVVSGLVAGLSPGLHGFHVHRDGKLGNDCTDAGPHFNPDNATHAGPADEARHAGDLGNIEANGNGYAEFAIVSERLSLVPDSKYYVVGRAVVVHEKQDDLGKGGDEESLKTGNAGSRLACCIIRPLHY